MKHFSRESGSGQRRTDISVRELFQLKQRFGVSAQAIAYRCKDLGIIGQSLLTQVFKTFNANNWRLHEPLEMAAERPQRFKRLCIRALAEDLISESKASELLGKTVRELVESLDKPPAEPRGIDQDRVPSPVPASAGRSKKKADALPERGLKSLLPRAL